MSNTRSLWIALATLLVVSFSILLWMGVRIDQSAPPMPAQVVAGGELLYTRAEIEKGRQVWQSPWRRQMPRRCDAQTSSTVRQRFPREAPGDAAGCSGLWQR
jgi:hypothetical protein